MTWISSLLHSKHSNGQNKWGININNKKEKKKKIISYHINQMRCLATSSGIGIDEEPCTCVPAVVVQACIAFGA